MRAMNLLTYILFSFSTVCCFTALATEYPELLKTERYQALIEQRVIAEQGQNLEEGVTFIPPDAASAGGLSQESAWDLLCAFEGSIFVGTSLGGLSINIADDQRRMDFELFHSTHFSSNHQENVNLICDSTQLIVDYGLELTLCAPMRSRCN